jgi:hypothetical protein
MTAIIILSGLIILGGAFLLHRHKHRDDWKTLGNEWRRVEKLNHIQRENAEWKNYWG